MPFDSELIRRYDGPLPRYTSYPPATAFVADVGPHAFADAATHSSTGPLSAYVHVPFCTAPCFYCGCNRIITRQLSVAETYLQRLIAEIALKTRLMPERRRIEQLHLGGGTPTFFDSAQLRALMHQLDLAFGLDESDAREFSIEIDPRTLGPDTMRDLAGLSFNRVSLGVQDFDADVQRAANRVQPYEMTRDAIRDARGAGMRSVAVDLICGLPRQTPERFAQTLAQVVGLRPDRIALYAYAHLPELFKAQRRIDRAELPSLSTRLELMQMAAQQLREAGYRHIGLDHFALPEDELSVALDHGTLQRNFQGYSTRGGLDLLGFGVSAIGRIGTVYSQNHKTLDAYYAALDAGQPPIARGYRMNVDDELRADVIAGVMCRGRIDLDALSNRYGLDAHRYFDAELARLRAHERDGLIAFRDGLIVVTDRGRHLLRAIAAVFDPRLHTVTTPHARVA